MEELRSVGLRSAAIFDCKWRYGQLESLSFLTAEVRGDVSSFGAPVAPNTLKLVTIDLEDNSISVHDLGEVEGNSVRSIAVVDKCHAVYVSLDEGASFYQQGVINYLSNSGSESKVFVKDVCKALAYKDHPTPPNTVVTKTITAPICNGKGCEFIWDFEIAANGYIYFNFISILPNGPIFKFAPFMGVASMSDVMDGQDSELNVVGSFLDGSDFNNGVSLFTLVSARTSSDGQSRQRRSGGSGKKGGGKKGKGMDDLTAEVCNAASCVFLFTDL